jgi:hypothetical protein
VTGRAGASGAAGAQGTGAAPVAGGALGSAGSVGSSGTAGTGAVGGAASCTIGGVSVPPPPNCGDAACGNNMIDSCIWVSPCGNMRIAETCDPGDLGGWTCAALRYASGTPICSPTCQLDGSTCSECAAGGPPTVLCADPPVGVNPWTIRLAATDDELGLLWLAPGNRQDGATLEFDRLSPDLQLLSAQVFSTGLTAGVGTSKDFDVAPAPWGWTIVGWGSEGIFVHSIDSAGVDRNQSVVHWGGSLVEGPLLVPRPGGAPLIAWVSTGSVVPPGGPSSGMLHVVAVDEFGIPSHTVNDLIQDDWTRPHGFTFAGDAFFAAVVVGTPANPGQIRVQRIETDGTPTTVVDALRDVNATFVVPFACDSDLCLNYNARFPGATDDANTAFQWTKVDANGIGANFISILTFPGDSYRWAAPLMLGGDVVTVLGGAPDDTLDVARSSVNGGLSLNLASTIIRYGGQSTTVPALAVRGSDLLVAWGPAPRGHMRIARVSF